MKLKGKTLEPPKPVDIVLPRGDDVIHLRAQAVFDYSEFEKACPEPTPPFKMKPGEKPPGTKDFDDKGYKRDWAEWYDRRTGWMLVKSLSATDGLEFDAMRADQPATCSQKGLFEELTKSGFLDAEVDHIVRCIRRANALDERHMEEIRQRFLRQQAEQSSE